MLVVGLVVRLILLHVMELVSMTDAESTYGLRLFTPDGSPGKASVNDWEENPATFQLQVCNLMHLVPSDLV